MSRTVSPSDGKLTAWPGSAESGGRPGPPSTAAAPRPATTSGAAAPRPGRGDAGCGVGGAIRAVLAAVPFRGEGHRKVWARLRHAGVRSSGLPGRMSQWLSEGGEGRNSQLPAA